MNSRSSTAQSQPDVPDDIRLIQSLDTVPLILDVCSRTTGMGFTAIARVTDERWITCASLDTLAFGLNPGDELDVSSTICHEVRAARAPVLIDNVDTDPVFCTHHTPRRYGFKSYVSVPIVRRDKSFFGTLCAIDPAPRDLSGARTLEMFTLFAELIAQQLDSQAQLEDSRTALRTAESTARLREEFIGVVGHDLRNPVAAIAAGLRQLKRSSTDDRSDGILVQMNRTVLRMGALIENLLDLTRGRLGEGMTLQIAEGVDLAEVIGGVAQEIRAVTEQPIEMELDLPAPVRCDPNRVGQLVSNLLGNAVTHGAPGAPIRVSARREGAEMVVTVTNSGPQIPSAELPVLFQPYARGGHRPGQQGLGLGLYISAEIARAHGGTLTATSDAAQTAFVFTLPA